MFRLRGAGTVPSLIMRQEGGRKLSPFLLRGNEMKLTPEQLPEYLTLDNLETWLNQQHDTPHFARAQEPCGCVVALWICDLLGKDEEDITDVGITEDGCSIYKYPYIEFSHEIRNYLYFLDETPTADNWVSLSMAKAALQAARRELQAVKEE